MTTWFLAEKCVDLTQLSIPALVCHIQHTHLWASVEGPCNRGCGVVRTINSRPWGARWLYEYPDGYLLDGGLFDHQDLLNEAKRRGVDEWGRPLHMRG